jgi:hypothetical protein
MSKSERLECSVWTNGKSGWGIRVLGGPELRLAHFRRNVSPVVVEVDGFEQQFNVNKKSFWTKTCGELIGKPLAEWKNAHSLKSGDHVWLTIVEPFHKFRLEIQ